MTAPLAAVRAGSLFSGVAGLDLAVAGVLGTEPVWFCDNDPAASRVLARRFPVVPNLGDITTVDWSRVEPVAVLTAGWPCQPWSAAGQRRGIEDERALWPEVARALRALRPRVVALENVARIVGVGELARACADLAALGYRFCWTVLGADEVGCCHRRNRCFVLAVADPGRDPWPEDHPDSVAAAGRGGTAADTARDGRQQGRTEPAGQCGGSDVALGGGAVVADPGHVGPPRQRPARYGWARPADGGQPAADPDSDGRESVQRIESRLGSRADADGRGPVDWGTYTTAIRRWERVIGRAAPVPRVVGPRGGLKLNPALPEWMQGFPAGWITDVPGVSVNDALRLAGNSVNPYQATAALRWCAAQLDERAS